MKPRRWYIFYNEARSQHLPLLTNEAAARNLKKLKSCDHDTNARMSITVHNCDLGEFTVTLDARSPVFTLITTSGDIYRANTYAFRMSFTNPLMHDEVPNVFKQIPKLEFDAAGFIRATMSYKQNEIMVTMRKLSGQSTEVTSALLEYISRLESRIGRLEKSE